MTVLEIPETHRPTTETSNDGRQYKSIGIEQQGNSEGIEPFTLRCVLISDPLATEKGAAAMTVHVGQMHDPSDGHGIAHLTEHMLFMGSTLYENENEYDTYLSQNGGYHNAYTDLELTNYYFECTAKALSGALQRFAAGFTCPLLRSSTVEREINAVDSEHGKNKQQDTWRIHQLSRTILGNLSTPSSHPYGSFGTGNKATLLYETLSLPTNEPTVAETTETTVATTEEKEADNKKKEEQIEKLTVKVKEFYQKYYTVEKMALVVMGNQSIDELETMVRTYFTNLPVPNDAASAAAFVKLPPLSIPPGSLPQIVEVVPVRKESQSIELQWIVPEQLTLYSTKPLRYYSHLIGHEGPGSLLAALRDLQYAQELYADDTSKSTTNFCIFTVAIELTEIGMEHIPTVLQMVLYYIRNICNTIPSWVYDELKVTGDTQFRFLSKQGAADTVSTIAGQMQYYKQEHYLSGPYKIFDTTYDATLITERAGKYLCTTDNLLVILSSVLYEGTTDSIDPYYETNYRIVTKDQPGADDHGTLQVLLNIDSNFTNLDPSITALLRLPDENDMLPSNFDLLSSTDSSYELFKKSTASATSEDTIESTTGATTDSSAIVNDDDPAWMAPICIMDDEVCRVWYKPDTVKFNTPKCNVLTFFRTPDVAVTPKLSVLGSLYTEIITELCNEFAYAASMAGLHCGFSNSTNHCGFEIHISGYNHKVSILLQRICHTIVHDVPVKVNDALFDRVKDKLLEYYASILMGQPYQYGTMVADACIETGNVWSIQDRLECINDITMEEFIQFTKTILSRFYLEVLVHGNVTVYDATDYTNIFLKAFQPQPPLHMLANRVVQLPTGMEGIHAIQGYNPDNDNSCIINLYEIGPTTPLLTAKLGVLNQIIREPAFNTLRTIQQLGYVVFTSVKTSGDDVKSILVLIQSDAFDPTHLNERIEDFLNTTFRDKLVNMSDEEYQSNLNAVRESLLEKNKNLTEESSKHWQVISNQTYRFNRFREVAALVETITKDDIITLYDTYITTKAAERKKVSIQIHGKNHTIPSSFGSTSSNSAADNNTGATNEAKTTQPQTAPQIYVISDPKDFVREQSLYPIPPSPPIQVVPVPKQSGLSQSIIAD